MHSLKNILPFFAMLFFCTLSWAQESRYPFELSLGGGVTTLYGDMEDQRLGGSAMLRFAYRKSSAFSVGIEAHHGILRAAGTMEEDTEQTDLLVFYSALLDVRMRPVLFFNPRYGAFHRNKTLPEFVESFYVGTGGGLTYNYQWRRAQTSRATFVIPVNIGFDIPLTRNYYIHKQLFYLNLNAQGVFATNDDMDGYNPGGSNDKRNDMYTVYSVGLIMKL